jgi:RNA polymerase sigma-70 factor (ECF subfamily)
LDKDVFLRLSNGDATALGELMKSYFPLLCGYAEHFVRDSSLAKDIVQEVFIKLWQYKGRFEAAGNLKAFLYLSTRNGCLNSLRSLERESDRRVKATYLDAREMEAIDESIVRLEYMAEINKVVQQLPLKMREVFRLSFEEGLSIEEIAKKMGISAKTVRNQKYKTLVVLRRHFGQTGIPLLFLISGIN